MKKLAITFIVLDILAGLGFLLCYSNIKIFKDFQYMIISTSTSTKTHGYIAYTFWKDDYISKVTSETSFKPINENINLDDIVIDTKPKSSYENEYEEQVLTRDEGNEYYKYIKVNFGGFDAHLVAIYNPEYVKLLSSKQFNSSTGKSGNETVTQLANRYGAAVAINGGGFKQDSEGYSLDIPMGNVIKDGKIIWSRSNNASSMIGFNTDNKLVLVNCTPQDALDKYHIRDALEFGPFLIVNGKTSKVDNNVSGYSRAPRTMIAQRKDGIVLFLVTEGTHANGPTLYECIDELLKYGAYNAANLDGGTSSQIVINGKLLNDPRNIYNQKVEGGRRVVTGFGLIIPKEEEKNS